MSGYPTISSQHVCQSELHCDWNSQSDHSVSGSFKRSLRLFILPPASICSTLEVIFIMCSLIVDMVKQMKVKLKKARLLVTDIRRSCNHRQHVAAEANKQARLALSDVCI